MLRTCADTPIGILLYKKLALPNILRVADSNRARTLELLRRGVGVIHQYFQNLLNVLKWPFKDG